MLVYRLAGLLIRWPLIGLTAFSYSAFGQADSSRIRNRAIDCTEYDRLSGSLAYAQNKTGAANRLLALSDKLFTPQDEEYFNTRFLVYSYFQQAYDFRTATRCLTEAVDSYERHYPFYHRGYATVTVETAQLAYPYLAMLYNSIGLYDKAVALLRPLERMISTAGGFVRQSYHMAYSSALLGSGVYDEALSEAFKLKDLTESGALDVKMPLPDEVFKIDDSWPEETKKQMLEAKEQYKKTLLESSSSVSVWQQMLYNQVIGTCYFEQYRFDEALPYLEAYLSAYKKGMENSMKVMESSLNSATSLPDSMMRSMEDSRRYLSLINEVGGQSASLIISAGKSNKLREAEPFAAGLIDKAIYAQVSNDLVQAEQQYRDAFARLDALSKLAAYGPVADPYRKGYAPFLLNLHVQKADFATALREATAMVRDEEESLKRNFRYFSEAEKKEFFRAYTRKLEKYYSLLLLMTENGQDRSEELLNKVLQTKGIILDVTREQDRALRKIKDPAVLSQVREIRQIREKLAAFSQAMQKNPGSGLSDSISRNALRLSQLEGRVNEKLGTGTDPLTQVSWKQVQSKLKAGEAYIEVLRLPRDNFSFDKPLVQYWAFVVRPDAAKPILFKLREGEALDSRGLKYYQNMMRTLQEDKFSYDVFWAQVGEKLQGASSVILSPDGAYHMINPLTLKNPKSGNYLASEIQFRRVATGRDLLATSTLTSRKSIELVGNPEFTMARATSANRSLTTQASDVADAAPEGTRAGFADLPGTGEEVELIVELAVSAGYSANPLTGIEASESNVKKISNPGVLHVATHGEFDQRSKADSYLRAKLVLAGAADPEPLSVGDYSRYEDGFLTAFEVLQLELSQTGLVVLSACETGLGEVQSGEGVWGLQRAFQLAGARAVMGSLWKISDEATVTFMESFYKSYFAGESLGASYRKATEAARKANGHPYYWGAFVLSGNYE